MTFSSTSHNLVGKINSGSLLKSSTSLGLPRIVGKVNSGGSFLKSLTYSTSASRIGEDSVHSCSTTSRQVSLDAIRRKCSSILEFDEPSLLRAADLSSILRCMGSAFRSNRPEANNFNKSYTATSIDAFVSHNWSTHPLLKFLTLALHFNLKIALASSGLLFLAMLILSYLQIIQYEFAGNLLLFFGPPFFWMIVIFGRDFASLLHCSGPRVFLDKLCIHQTDKNLMRRGIMKLGAYIHVSSSMVVVFTPVYLKKLWTVYELATLLALDESCEKVVFLTPVLTKLVLSLSIIGYLMFNMKTWFEETFGLDLSLSYLLLYPGIVMMVYTMHGWANTRKGILSDFSSFSVTHASVFCEDDRPMIHATIRKIMIAIGACTDTDTEELALACFDNMVHDLVPVVLDDCKSKNILRFRDIFIATLPLLWLKVYWTFHNEQHRDDLLEKATWGLYNAIEFATVWIIFAIASWCVQLNTSIVGRKKVAFVMCIGFCLFAFHLGAEQASKKVRELAESSPTALFLFACSVVIVYALAWCLYAKKKRTNLRARFRFATHGETQKDYETTFNSELSVNAHADWHKYQVSCEDTEAPETLEPSNVGVLFQPDGSSPSVLEPSSSQMRYSYPKQGLFPLGSLSL